MYDKPSYDSDDINERALCSLVSNRKSPLVIAINTHSLFVTNIDLILACTASTFPVFNGVSSRIIFLSMSINAIDATVYDDVSVFLLPWHATTIFAPVGSACKKLGATCT